MQTQGWLERKISVSSSSEKQGCFLGGSDKLPSVLMDPIEIKQTFWTLASCFILLYLTSIVSALLDIKKSTLKMNLPNC